MVSWTLGSTTVTTGRPVARYSYTRLGITSPGRSRRARSKSRSQRYRQSGTSSGSTGPVSTMLSWPRSCSAAGRVTRPMRTKAHSGRWRAR